MLIREIVIHFTCLVCGVDVYSSLRLCLLSNSFGSAAEWHRCSNLNVSYSWLMKFNIIKTRNFHFYVFCLLFFGSTTKWHRCSNLNVSYKLTSEVQHYQNRNFYFNVFCFGLALHQNDTGVQIWMCLISWQKKLANTLKIIISMVFCCF